jgi:nucleoid DNA-binding protein
MCHEIILRDARKMRAPQDEDKIRITAKQKPGWNFQPGFEFRRVRSA